MAIEFLLVTFPEQRGVLADGTGVGFTNHVLMLPGDEYEITIDGSGCTPASHLIALAGTSMVKPLVISFAQAVAVSRATRGAPIPVSAQTAEPAVAMAQARAVPPTDVARKRAKKPLVEPAEKSVTGVKKSVVGGAKKTAKQSPRTSAAKSTRRGAPKTAKKVARKSTKTSTKPGAKKAAVSAKAGKAGAKSNQHA